MDARCIRRHALRAGVGSHHSRPGHEQSDSRGFRYAYFAGLRHRRRTFWLHRRSHWTETGANVEHPHLFHLLFRFWTGHFSSDARRVSLYPRSRNGGRVEYRSNAGGRNLAHRVARQSDLHCAEFLGNRLRARGPGGRNCIALCELANSFLRRNPAGAGHFVDPQGRAGVGNVAGASSGG